jgi:hypothetical protein
MGSRFAVNPISKKLCENVAITPKDYGEVKEDQLQKAMDALFFKVKQNASQSVHNAVFGKKVDGTLPISHWIGNGDFILTDAQEVYFRSNPTDLHQRIRDMGRRMLIEQNLARKTATSSAGATTATPSASATTPNSAPQPS